MISYMETLRGYKLHKPMTSIFWGKGSTLTREISPFAFPVCRADSREGVCAPVKMPDVLAGRIDCVGDRQRRSELDRQGSGGAVHDQTRSGVEQECNCHTYVSKWH